MKQVMFMSIVKDYFVLFGHMWCERQFVIRRCI